MLLRVVAQSLKPVKLFSQQLPTFLLFRDRRSVAQQCWIRLHSSSLWAYATGRQKEEDDKTCVRDKRDRAITCVLCRDLHLTLMFSRVLQKDLFKVTCSLSESFFKQNHCHVCHTRFAVFFLSRSVAEVHYCWGHARSLHMVSLVTVEWHY